VEPCVHVITLAVDDLERALTFYPDGLGLATKGVVADGYEGSETEAAGAIVPFKLNGGLILSLYPAASSPRTHAFHQPRQPLASSALDTSSEKDRRSTRYSLRPKKQARR
jgi:catechol 2,3-dioxygenase-like lactoylglutathione lyase family enzyme